MKLINIFRIEPEKPSFDRDRTLTVKGVAILMLLFYHLFHEAEALQRLNVNYAPFSERVFLTLAGFGNLCVGIFVFLTAFGICRKPEEREVKGAAANAPATNTPAASASGAGSNAGKNPALRIAMKEACKRAGKLMGNFLILYLSAILFFWRSLNLPGLYGPGKQGFLYGLADALGLAALFDTPQMNPTWWYMSLAYTLIFLVPLLRAAYKKVGPALIPLVFLVTFLIPMDEGLAMYAPTAALGIWAAEERIPDRVTTAYANTPSLWICSLLLLALIVPLRQNFYVQESFLPVVDAFAALLLVLFAGGLLHRIPVLRQILQFLGKYSMDMYLIHTFFYLMVWQPFVYRFGYFLVTYLILIALSLLYAVILGGIRTAGRFLLSDLREKVTKP
ncbi:MAG: acyltransferase [Lachnospiraceae bacterium]|nr:acyltransferase [Lachnospiraceae bacterium]